MNNTNQDMELRLGSDFKQAEQVQAWPVTYYSQVVGGTTNAQGTITTNWQPYYDYWHQWIPNYWPVYIQNWNNQSKIETAFKILQSLMNLKIVKLDKVSDFIEAVNKIAEVL